MSSISSSADLTTKYQKLAAEYAKLRAQVPVLKRAVLDEQGRFTSIQDELKGRNQIIRKLESEVESLVFRNDQLAKRVEHLQDNYAKLSSPKHNKKNKEVPRSQSSFTVSASESVLQEELSNKLQQNEMLHSQIFELVQKHESAMEESEKKMRQMENENVKLQKEMASIKNRHQAVLEDVSTEKAKLQKELEELKGFQNVKISTPQSPEVYPDENNPFLDNSDSLENGHDESLMIDSGYCVSNEQKTKLCFKDIKRVCQQINTSFINIFIYTKQRSLLYPCDGELEPVSQENILYCDILSKTSELFVPFADSVINLLEKCQMKQDLDTIVCDLSSVIQNFGCFFELIESDLAPNFLKSLSEECAISWCSPRLEEENERWKTGFAAFLINDLGALNNVFDAFDEKNFHIDTFIDDLTSALTRITTASNDLSVIYNKKLTIEQRLPTATKKFRASNECLFGSIGALTKQFQDLINCFSSQYTLIMKEFWREIQKVIVGKSPSPLPALREDSFNVIEPQDERAEQEIKLLKAELEEKCHIIIEHEKEREHWTVEMQLLQMKLENVHTTQSSDYGSEGDGQLIEKYYSNRLEQVMTDLQQNHTLTTYLQQECDHLVRLITVGQKQKEKLETDRKQADNQISSINDELETTREGYEGQLSSLSEHLAEMNVRLTEKTDEINMLKENANTERKGTRRLRLMK